MAAVDLFGAQQSEIAPMNDTFPITPNDSEDIEFVSRTIMIGDAGVVRVITNKGITRDLSANLARGVYHAIRVRRVLSTGTTATDIWVGI